MPWHKCPELEWIEHRIWAFEGVSGPLRGLPKLWPLWGCWEQATQPPLCCWFYCFIVTAWTRGPCFSVTRCFPGHPATQTVVGDGSPLSSVLAVVRGCPAPPPPLTPGWSPGPLRFQHMSGEVTLATAGMSLGGSRAPLPPVIRLLASVSESHLEGSFYPFYLQGEIYPPQAVAAGSRQMAAPQRHPEGQLLPVLCSCGLLSVVPHRGCVCVGGGVGWGLITGPNCLGSRPSSATC